MSGLRVEAVADTARPCACCPRLCRVECPVTRHSHDEATLPNALSGTVFTAARAQRPPDAAEARQLFRGCTLCGACGVPCLVDGVDLPRHVLAGRADAVAAGAVPPPALPCSHPEREACCGRAARDAGLPDEAARLAEAWVGEAPAEVSCRAWLADRGRRLADRAWAAPAASAATIAYHDACLLARGSHRDHEGPRAALAAAGAAVRDLPRSRERARCCGAGGGLPQTAPAIAAAMAAEIVADARATGATALATGSPRCGAHLRAHGDGLEILVLGDR